MIPLERHEVMAIVEMVLRTALGNDEPCAESSSVANDNATLSAMIGVDGAWRGTIAVHFPASCASAAAAALLHIPVARVAAEDAEDALAELTNVIGGNIRSLIAVRAGNSCSQTLPVVGHDFLPQGQAPQRLSLALQCGGHALTVTLMEGGRVDPKAHSRSGSRGSV